MKIRKIGKIMLIIILLFSSQMFNFYRKFGGLWFSPELPRIIMIIYPWLLSSLCLLTFLTLFKDIFLIIRLIVGIFGKKIRNIFSIRKFQLFTLIFCYFLGAFSVWEAVKVPNVKVQEVYFDKLPKELDGTTIILIADLHSSALNNHSFVEGVVKKVNKLNPDLILFNGDMIDGSVKNRTNDVEPLKNLKSKYGIFGSLGNHDFYLDHHKWLKKFDELGIKILVNQHKNININGNFITIIGINDIQGTRSKLIGPDIVKATKGINKNNVTLLLDHRPEFAPKNAKYNIDLQLSGHTHGGMVLGLDRYIARHNNGYVSRWYDVGNMKLYVSNGTSLWCGFPIRLGVPAEITKFILRSKKDSNKNN
ncbi:metallophosphoesterase [Fusobacterium sp. PH5-29]